MNSEELYAKELKQSDIDHHTPTAGAMTGHIIANLVIHMLKISQVKLFADGDAELFLEQHAQKWGEYEAKEFDQLNRILVANGESIPTTTEQMRSFTMLEENGAEKYLSGHDQLFNLVKDFDAQILFTTKAIALAEKEKWPELAQNLIDFQRWIKEQIMITQRFLGHEIREGLYNEDDK